MCVFENFTPETNGLLINPNVVPNSLSSYSSNISLLKLKFGQSLRSGLVLNAAWWYLREHLQEWNFALDLLTFTVQSRYHSKRF